MRNRHILLVGNTAWSMYNFRRNIVTALIGEGCRVTVVAPEDYECSQKINGLGCDFRPVGMNAKGVNPLEEIRLIRDFYRIFKSLRPDFIFFYTVKPNIYGSLVAGRLKIPHIAVTTGLGYAFICESIVSRIVRGLYRRALRHAEQVWFLNGEDERAFIGHRLVREKQTVLMNGEGVDTVRFAPCPLPDTVSFLLVARMLWDKGIGEYVEAARMLKRKYPGIRFKLLGPAGVDNPSRIPQERIDAWVKEGVVEYLGYTQNVVPVIEQAACVVLPSYREGIPLSLLEAAAMGRPVVTTDAPGCRETVEDRETGFLCKPRDAGSLAEAMERIIRMDAAQLERMGMAGRKKVEEEFDLDGVTDFYLKTLRTQGVI